MSDANNLTLKKILFIGGGNMATAIIAGLTKINNNHQQITVLDHHSDKLFYLKNTFHIQTINSITELKNKTDIIILAVKPMGIKQACQELRDYCSKDTLIISVAAGVTINYLSKQLPGFNNIIRSMPNTPATIGQGITVLYHEIKQHASYHQTLADNLFKTIGKTFWVEQESDINTTMAISGCGPAYLFLLCESLMAAAENLCINKNLAKELIVNTISGACKLYHHSEKSASSLRQQVTSPNGTTDAAITILDPELTKKTYIKALQAAVNKAKIIEQDLIDQENC